MPCGHVGNIYPVPREYLVNDGPNYFSAVEINKKPGALPPPVFEKLANVRRMLFRIFTIILYPCCPQSSQAVALQGALPGKELLNR